MLALVAVVAPAGCGGGGRDGGGRPGKGDGPGATTSAAKPSLSRLDAIREAQSVAAQEAFRRDYSIPPQDFVVTCTPLAAVNGRPRYECRFRSREGCAGSDQVAVLPDGSPTSRFVAIKCGGRPNI